MKIIDFKKIREKVYYEKLDNGIDVYLYPTTKSKNFYCTFSTKYGSSVLKYKKGEKVIDVYPGTAHFLEHKVMNFTTNPDFFKRVNKLGSVTNAYTTYNVTNYNIFGSVNILENLSLIFDMVLNPIITKENVENEIGIISEEIDMDEDNINVYSYTKRLQNIFYNAYPINHILGKKEDINKMTSSYLKQIYNDFYTPNNMFIIVVGNFNKEEVLEYITNYMKKVKNKTTDKIKLIKSKEPDKVKIEYEEIHKNINENKIHYSLKINKNIFKDYNKRELSYYLYIILSSNFSSTSALYEKYKKEKIVNTMGAGYKKYDNHIIITIEANVDNKDIFIESIKKDINNLFLAEETFNRKKRKLLSELILGFENIEDVEYLITTNILEYKRLLDDNYEVINSLKYKEIEKILKKIPTDNYSVLVCKK